MNVSLATIYHDPEGRLYDQIKRLTPTLKGTFGGIAIQASSAAWPESLEVFRKLGALIQQDPLDARVRRLDEIGKARRDSVKLALEFTNPFVLYCDCDRILHWAERYAGELAQVVRMVAEYDFTVVGRTFRAFDSHPRIQYDTETIINRVFARVSGREWDVTAAARGLSRRAAEAVIQSCLDDQISTDVTWPLCLLRRGGFSFGYLETEGLEFETGDRFPEEVARAGGLERWMEGLDRDPRAWALRLELARIEVEAMSPFQQERKE